MEPAASIFSSALGVVTPRAAASRNSNSLAGAIDPSGPPAMDFTWWSKRSRLTKRTVVPSGTAVT